jgi:hypothetical protein
VERFSNGQRVKITTDALTKGISMLGKVGTVVRIRMQDNGAWIEMDDPLPEELASFELGDNRRNHIIFYPEECEPFNQRLS